jgi:hypothetical protein
MADHLRRMLDALAPTARDLGCADELDAARGLIDRPRAAAARAAADGDGARSVTRWLASRFLG